MDAVHYYAVRRAARSTADRLDIDAKAILTLLLIHELGGSALSSQLYAITAVDGARVREATYTLEQEGFITREAKDGKPARPGVTTKFVITNKGVAIAELSAELVQSIMTSIIEDSEHGIGVEEVAS